MINSITSDESDDVDYNGLHGYSHHWGHTLQVYIGESFLIDTGGCTAGDQQGLSSWIGKMTLFVSNVHYAATTVSH